MDLVPCPLGLLGIIDCKGVTALVSHHLHPVGMLVSPSPRMIMRENGIGRSSSGIHTLMRSLSDEFEMPYLRSSRGHRTGYNCTTAIEAAAKHGVDLTRVEVSNSDQLDGAFDALKDRDVAAQRRLPAIYEYRGHVVEGGLISYAGDVRDNYRRAAVYVDRILRGARPADLPIDHASRFELVINNKTAKTLGIT